MKCGETMLEGQGHVKILLDSLYRMVLWKLLNTCGEIFGACLSLRLNSCSVKGASHQSAFIGNFQTISHTFYSPVYATDEGNEDVASV